MSTQQEKNETESLEDLKKEITKLKEQIDYFKEEINILNIDRQMKNLKINFLEQRTRIQDEQILDLKTTLTKRIEKIEEKIKNGKIIEDKVDDNKEDQESKKGEIDIKENKKDEVSKIEDAMKGELKSLGSQLQELEKIKLIKYGNQITEKKKEEKIAEDDGRMDLKFKKDLATNAVKKSSGTQNFSVFKSLKGDAILCWATDEKTIELYDLEKETPIKAKKDAHTKDIYCCRHFIDKKTNSDLLISSSYENSIKVWNVDNMDAPIVMVDKPHSSGFIFSCCILSHEKLNKNYILSSADNDAIKVFDFNGKFIKEGIKFNGYINLLSTYYDKKEDKFLVIDANSRNIEVFDFNDLSKSYRYFKLKIDCVHSFFIVYENENTNQVQLIDSNMNGFIHIWDFHTAECLKSIPIETAINGICLWDNQYAISTGKNKQIKIIDLNEGKVIRSLEFHTKDTLSVQKINLTKYGDCLISHGLDKCLKLWTF